LGSWRRPRPDEWARSERVATIELEQKITGAFILGNEFFGIGETDVGMPMLYVYTIVD